MTVHDFKRFPELTNSQMRMFYFDSPHKQINEDFFATVIKVTDGDTIRVEVDFRDFNFPVRFLDTDAPEMDTRAGRNTQKWLENLILNKEVEVFINSNNRVDKWGRLLGEIFFQGMNINKLSMLEGRAVKFGNAPTTPFE
jgi:endonuclease YncB( thermonuclease family)